MASSAVYAVHIGSLRHVGFGNETLVHLTCVIVGGPCGGLLGRSDRRPLLTPALADGRQTPFGAPARGTNRFPVDDSKDRICVRRRQNACSNPAAPLDRHVE